MIKTVTVSEASRGFSDLINRVRYQNETAILVKGGKAVARISPMGNPGLTGKELSDIWAKLPHLSLTEAEAFARDIESGQRALPKIKDKWA